MPSEGKMTYQAPVDDIMHALKTAAGLDGLIASGVLEGVDEETWNHHLRRGDYSAWFRKNIGDDALADEAAKIERDATGDTRARMREAIERHYTLPA